MVELFFFVIFKNIGVWESVEWKKILIFNISFQNCFIGKGIFFYFIYLLLVLFIDGVSVGEYCLNWIRSRQVIVIFFQDLGL